MLADTILQRKPSYRPGSKYEYSNLGYGILGAILIIIRRSINSNSDLSPDKEERLYKELSDNLASINPKWFRVEMRRKCMKLMSRKR